MRTDTHVVLTSQASAYISCPDGYKLIVELVTGRNDTRGPTYSLAYAPAGRPAVTTYSLTGTATADVPVLGGVWCNLSNICCVNGPLELYPGDALTITNTNFVANDVVQYNFIFRRVKL